MRKILMSLVLILLFSMSLCGAVQVEKEKLGLKGPVREVTIQKAELFSESTEPEIWISSEWHDLRPDGTIKTYRNDSVDQEKRVIKKMGTPLIFDEKERILVMSGGDTFYDDQARTFSVKNKSGVVFMVGELNSRGQIVSRSLIREPEKKPLLFSISEYDDDGNLIYEPMFTVTKPPMLTSVLKQSYSGEKLTYESKENTFMKSEKHYKYNDKSECTEYEFIQTNKKSKVVRKVKLSYRYSDYDSYGNWTKRTTVEHPEESVIRKITYFE